MDFIKKNGKKIEFNREEIELRLETALKDYPPMFYKGFPEEVSKGAELFYEMNRQIPSGYDIDDYIFYKLIEKGYMTVAKQFERLVAIEDYLREQSK